MPLLCVKWKTPDDGLRNCPKHVEFHSKNKFEKLLHLVGFIIRIYHDARPSKRQICRSSTYKIFPSFTKPVEPLSFVTQPFTGPYSEQEKSTSSLINTLFTD